MQFRILGPLEVVDANGRRMEIAGHKPRALLAMLLLRANEVVPIGRLIDGLWDEDPPEGAGKAVQIYVSRVRKALGDSAEVIETRAGGYAVSTAAAELDLERFDQLEREARRALDEGAPETAASRLDEALALWRGPPLAEFTGEAFAHEIAGLAERRLVAIEARVDAELAVGRHVTVVAELGNLVEEHPFRERLRGQLMIALARSGRQADALRVYDEGRRRLVGELGIEPGASLRDLHTAILRQEPSVVESPRPASPPTIARRDGDGAPAVPETPRRRGRARVAAGVAALLALGVATAAVLVAVNRAGGDAAPANVVARVVPPEAEIGALIPVGERPTAVAFGLGSAWVASARDRMVSRIDPETLTVEKTIGLGFVPGALAVGENAVWVVDTREGTLVRYNAVTGATEGTFDVGRGGRGPASVAVAEGSVWVANSNAFQVVRVDVSDRRIVARIPVDAPREMAASGSEGVWVVEASTAVVQVDPVTNEVGDRLTTGFTPGGLALGADSVWVSYPADDTVWRFHAPTRSFRRTIPVGGGPRALAFGSGFLWVANTLDRTVSRLDPDASAVTASLRLGGRPTDVAAGGRSVWVAVSER